MNIYDLSEMVEKLKHKTVKHLGIQISDNERLVTEECLGIELFDENTVKLRTAFGVMTVTGLDLRLNNFSDTGLLITGKLHSIEFDDNEAK